MRKTVGGGLGCAALGPRGHGLVSDCCLVVVGLCGRNRNIYDELKPLQPIATLVAKVSEFLFRSQ